MIVSRTPLRISFVGGGTDVKEFYQHNTYGAVISATIDKYIYVTVNKRFDNTVKASYSSTEPSLIIIIKPRFKTARWAVNCWARTEAVFCFFIARNRTRKD
jgi:galactokinase/mevalonate kinase-like predicted kinase